MYIRRGISPWVFRGLCEGHHSQLQAMSNVFPENHYIIVISRCNSLYVQLEFVIYLRGGNHLYSIYYIKVEKMGVRVISTINVLIVDLGTLVALVLASRNFYRNNLFQFIFASDIIIVGPAG